MRYVIQRESDLQYLAGSNPSGPGYVWVDSPMKALYFLQQGATGQQTLVEESGVGRCYVISRVTAITAWRARRSTAASQIKLESFERTEYEVHSRTYNVLRFCWPEWSYVESWSSEKLARAHVKQLRNWNTESCKSEHRVVRVICQCTVLP